MWTTFAHGARQKSLNICTMAAISMWVMCWCFPMWVGFSPTAKCAVVAAMVSTTLVAICKWHSAPWDQRLRWAM